MPMKALALATLLAALTAHAEPPSQQSASETKAPPAKPKPLSDEDAAIVKDLTLIENVDLLRHLDLFDDKAQNDAQANKEKRQP
jgi:hypothetical protein